MSEYMLDVTKSADPALAKARVAAWVAVGGSANMDRYADFTHGWDAGALYQQHVAGSETPSARVEQWAGPPAAPTEVSAGARVKHAAREDRELIDALIEVRKRLGLTQADVATRMGISKGVVYALEAQSSNPTMASLRRYAAGLGVRLHTYIVEA